MYFMSEGRTAVFTKHREMVVKGKLFLDRTNYVFLVVIIIFNQNMLIFGYTFKILLKAYKISFIHFPI